jgi:FkbM family methyltransferase
VVLRPSPGILEVSHGSVSRRLPASLWWRRGVGGMTQPATTPGRPQPRPRRVLAMADRRNVLVGDGSRYGWWDAGKDAGKPAFNDDWEGDFLVSKMTFIDLVVRLLRAYRDASRVQRGVWRIERALHHWIMTCPPTDIRRVHTRAGFTMNVNLRDFVQRVIYISGEWEPESTEVLRATLRSGDTFIDIGANVGYFSLLASALVGAEGKIIAFEPNPPTFNALTQNIALNRCTNVTALAVGLSDRTGAAELQNDTPENAGAASLVPRASPNANTVLVQLDTLDRVLEMRQIESVSMIKIDVEGAEVVALRGALETLRRHRPSVLCEVSEYSLEQMGDSKQALFDLMDGLGYAADHISPLRIGHIAEQRVYHQYDVLFTTKGPARY